jgi:hypothetical protein
MCASLAGGPSPGNACGVLVLKTVNVRVKVVSNTRGASHYPSLPSTRPYGRPGRGAPFQDSRIAK